MIRRGAQSDPGAQLELVQETSGQGRGARKGSEASTELAAKFERLKGAVEAESTAEVIQLGWWQDDQRAVPAEFIACALFAAISGTHSEYLDGVEIANANGQRITYKGKRLTQVHADVWQGIMHLARQLPHGSKVRFRAREFLRLIGRHTGKSQRKQLEGWLSDLQATSVTVIDSSKEEPQRFFGSLLPEGAGEDEKDDSVYVIQIPERLAALFETGFALIDWEQRQKLRGKWLARLVAAVFFEVQEARSSGAAASALWKFGSAQEISAKPSGCVAGGGGRGGARGLDPQGDRQHPFQAERVPHGGSRTAGVGGDLEAIQEGVAGPLRRAMLGGLEGLGWMLEGGEL
jgi:hypothetical protein